MQKILAHRAGRQSILHKKASVSAQKAHKGRKSSEKAQKNSTAPPRAPTSTKPRSCPAPRRSRKRNMTLPTIRQYAPSSTPVNRGARTRKGRSRSYSSPADSPRRMDCPNTSSCWAARLSMLNRTGGPGSLPGRSPGPHRSGSRSSRPHEARLRPETAFRYEGLPP